MTDENVAVVARLRAAKGKGDALAALLMEQAATVRRHEPGCLAYRVHRKGDDPDAFLFYELYVDAAAFEVHRKSPHLAAFRQRRESEGLVDGPAEVHIYRPVTD
jgi:autoinducer 2-degrading protein